MKNHGFFANSNHMTHFPPRQEGQGMHPSIPGHMAPRAGNLPHDWQLSGTCPDGKNPKNLLRAFFNPSIRKRATHSHRVFQRNNLCTWLCFLHLCQVNTTPNLLGKTRGLLEIRHSEHLGRNFWKPLWQSRAPLSWHCVPCDSNLQCCLLKLFPPPSKPHFINTPTDPTLFGLPRSKQAVNSTRIQRVGKGHV